MPNGLVPQVRLSTEKTTRMLQKAIEEGSDKKDVGVGGSDRNKKWVNKLRATFASFCNDLGQLVF